MKIKLNPDQEIVNTIREGLKRTGGYHRKSAHFSRNNGNRRIKVFGVMFRGDFQGKYGHRAALKCPIVLRTGQTTPRRFVVFG